MDEIELDLRMTGDGHLVIMHDERVDRTTDGTGLIAGFTLAGIRTLDAGSVFGERFRGERVPTWEEALELVRGRVRLNVHLKEEAARMAAMNARSSVRCAILRWRKIPFWHAKRRASEFCRDRSEHRMPDISRTSNAGGLYTKVG